MKIKRVLSSSLFTLFLAASSVYAIPVINEIRVDQPSGDNDEYFELFGTPGESLAGLSYVVIGDGTAGSGVIESVFDLGSFSIGSSGYFVVAESTFTLGVADAIGNLNFENSDNVTHLLVSGLSVADDTDLDTDDNGVLDSTPWTSVLDAVSLVESVGTGDLYYATALGGADVGPDGTFVPGHVYRLPDGGTWNIGIFDPATGLDSPGMANVPEPSVYAALLGLGALGFVAWRRRRA